MRTTRGALGLLAALALTTPAAATAAPDDGARTPAAAGTHAEHGPGGQSGPVRVARRTLIVEGTAAVDAVTIRERWNRLEVRLGDKTYQIERWRFDRVRVDLADGNDSLTVEGSAAGDWFDASASGDRVRISRGWLSEPIELDNVDKLRFEMLAGNDRVTVGSLSATDTFRVDSDLGAGVDRATVEGTNEDDQISVTAFSAPVAVIGPTFATFENPERTDRLVIEGRGGDDNISASTDAMALTLDGGNGGGTLRGGPGDDVLLGGDGFDDASGGRGNDVAELGRDFDRFGWAPGDGSDKVDGGRGRDSLFFLGQNEGERFELTRVGRRDVRLTRDLGGIVMDLDDVEEVDTLAAGGADTFVVGDLTGTPVELVDVSLAPGFGAPAGDGQDDIVQVTGTERSDELVLDGRVSPSGSGTATLTGLAAKVNVSHAEELHDTLVFDLRGGDDPIEMAGFDPATIHLSAIED
jgi:Ca2+-binding RTX toxin-like protein